MLIAILGGWLMCIIFTVFNVFSPEKDGWGHDVRVDKHSYVLQEAPWFRIPYPCGLHYYYYLPAFKQIIYPI